MKLTLKHVLAVGGLTHDFIWMRVPDIYRYFKKC